MAATPALSSFSHGNQSAEVRAIMGSEDAIARLICALACNVHTIVDVEQHPIGIGCFPRAAMFNHSCRPNCVQSFNGRRLVLRSLRKINAGEELTISYTELLSTLGQRRAELSGNYHFDLLQVVDVPPTRLGAERGAQSNLPALEQVPIERRFEVEAGVLTRPCTMRRRARMLMRRMRMRPVSGAVGSSVNSGDVNSGDDDWTCAYPVEVAAEQGNRTDDGGNATSSTPQVPKMDAPLKDGIPKDGIPKDVLLSEMVFRAKRSQFGSMHDESSQFGSMHDESSSAHGNSARWLTVQVVGGLVGRFATEGESANVAKDGGSGEPADAEEEVQIDVWFEAAQSVASNSTAASAVGSSSPCASVVDTAALIAAGTATAKVLLLLRLATAILDGCGAGQKTAAVIERGAGAAVGDAMVLLMQAAEVLDGKEHGKHGQEECDVLDGKEHGHEDDDDLGYRFGPHHLLRLEVAKLQLDALVQLGERGGAASTSAGAKGGVKGGVKVVNYWAMALAIARPLVCSLALIYPSPWPALALVWCKVFKLTLLLVEHPSDQDRHGLGNMAARHVQEKDFNAVGGVVCFGRDYRVVGGDGSMFNRHGARNGGRKEAGAAARKVPTQVVLARLRDALHAGETAVRMLQNTCAPGAPDSKALLTELRESIASAQIEMCARAAAIAN
jgi:hypothetical protein